MAGKTIRQLVAEAMPKQESRAWEAFFLVRSYGIHSAVPGLGTLERLAVRLNEGGYTVEEAAAREYLYRWRLALQSRVFGVPHTLGM